ncbi:hypothetical protein O181_021876 [Austropuccinia psidii MF-1]|uniref:Uncharacterized protein n=1 Tax=Austropuccinia psidii MF-1 TaxID=1389203 RepID=A0A9Q3CBT1_9BASI|nr:hypothetical protein [Austropuccinia psidii MF-1]
MLTRPHSPPDVTLTLPPISTLITPYTYTPPPCTILTLLRPPQDIPPTPPSHLPHPLCHLPCLRLGGALPTCLKHCLPSPPSSLLMLPHPCHSQSICSHGALKIYFLCLLPPI